MYELGNGRGRRFLGSSGGNVNQVESGSPFGFTFAGTDNVFLPGVLRPNLAPGKTYDDIRLDWDRYGPCRHIVACKLPWADINAFAIPASFTPGQTGRNILSGPGYVWHQITIAKQVPASERVNGTLRVDFNNPFKYPFFSRPNNTVNFRDPQTFGKITATQGSFSGLGGRLYVIAVFTLQF